MKIFFQGLGGAGQRHLRIFRSLLPNAEFIAFRRTQTTPLLKPDFNLDEENNLEDKYDITTVQSMEEAWQFNPDLSVISLPSSMQATASIEAANRGIDVFSEKPGMLGLNECLKIKEAIEFNKTNYFVSFQRRFHPLFLKMKDIIKSGEVGEIMSVSVNVASHVPDWHPYEDFRNLYACRKDLGGGVLRTECHEIDMICQLFGKPNEVKTQARCGGPYNLDVEDSVELLLDYKKFGVQISLCFIQQFQERKLVIYGQKGLIKCDFLRQSLTLQKLGKKTSKIEKTINMDDMFISQAKLYIKNRQKNTSNSLSSIYNLSYIFESLSS